MSRNPSRERHRVMRYPLRRVHLGLLIGGGRVRGRRAGTRRAPAATPTSSAGGGTPRPDAGRVPRTLRRGGRAGVRACRGRGRSSVRGRRHEREPGRERPDSHQAEGLAPPTVATSIAPAVETAIPVPAASRARRPYSPSELERASIRSGHLALQSRMQAELARVRPRVSPRAAAARDGGPRLSVGAVVDGSQRRVGDHSDLGRSPGVRCPSAATRRGRSTGPSGPSARISSSSRRMRWPAT